MNIENLDVWISIVANVGVIIGLVLVALQIKQNTAITKAQITNDYHLADMELELKMMGDTPAVSWTKALYSPDELTREDRAILDRYFNYGLIQINRLKEMRSYGLAEKDLSQRVSYLGWHFGNEVGRQWWAGIRGDYSSDSEFVEMVDRILKSEDPNQNRVTLENMLARKNESE